MHGRLDEEAHEAQTRAVFLLEALEILLAHVHHRLHVHFIERGQNGVGGLGLQQAFGHALAQPRHRHTLLRAALEQLGGIQRCANLRQAGCRGTGGNRRRGRRDRSRPDAGFQGRDHIAFGDAAVPAGALHLSGAQAVLGHHLGRRGHGDIALEPGRRRRGRRQGPGRGLGRRRSSGRRSAGCRRGAGGCFGIDHRDHFARDHGRAIRLDQAGNDARFRRRQFEHHLVGLDVDHVFVAGDRVTRFLVPLQQRRLGDRFRQLRNLDFDQCHVLTRNPVQRIWGRAYGGEAGTPARRLPSVMGVQRTGSSRTRGQPVPGGSGSDQPFLARTLTSPSAAAIRSFCCA